MKLRDAAQQALEALEWNYNTDLDNIPACKQWAKMLKETKEALRAALAEPEQEPVAWMHNHIEGNVIAHKPADIDRHRERWTALYPAPQPCQTCVALSRTVMMDQTSHDTAPTPRKPERDAKLWLWKNFVDGRPEYWAFDNAFPVHLDNGDPQTLGEPCGYALFKPSRKGRDASDEEVLGRIRTAAPTPRKPPQFPTMLRKMWSGDEVQEWINQNWS